MLGATHALGGLLAAEGLIYLKHVPLNEAPLVLGASVFGALLPDIDHPNSLLGRRAPVVSDAVGLVFEHRGFTHSLVFAGAVFLFLALLRAKYAAWLPVSALYGLGAGILSHLFFDMLNPSPVPLLWPLPKELRLPLPGIPTGSFFEAVFRLAVSAAVVFLFPAAVPVKEAFSLPEAGAAGIVRHGLSFAGEVVRIIGESLKQLAGKF
jgi:inner membrane protein